MSNQQKLKITIIDKDKTFIDALSQRLKKWDILCIGTTNGAFFFQISAQVNPDIIILSNNIKSPSWTEVLKRIKLSKTFNNTAIFLVCDHISTGLLHQTKLYDVKQIIKKPVVFSNFMKLILKETQKRAKAEYNKQ